MLVVDAEVVLIARPLEDGEALAAHVNPCMRGYPPPQIGDRSSFGLSMECSFGYK